MHLGDGRDRCPNHVDQAEHPADGPSLKKQGKGLFDPAILRRAAVDSFVEARPPARWRKNPVMFVVEIGSVLTTFLFFRDLGKDTASQNWFAGLVAVWLWFTVLFANFAEAVAEGRGKAQADTLRKTRSDTVAHVRRPDGTIGAGAEPAAPGRRRVRRRRPAS